jgi:hypothetical protein
MTKGSDFLCLHFTPNPETSSHISSREKIASVRSRFARYRISLRVRCLKRSALVSLRCLERSALVSLQNCSELRVQPTPDSFYVTGCLFRVHLLVKSTVYFPPILPYSHTWMRTRHCSHTCLCCYCCCAKCSHQSNSVGLTVFRFIIEYSSLMDFGPYLGNNK